MHELVAVVDTRQVNAQVATGQHCPSNFAEILLKYQDKVTALKKVAKAEDNMISILLKAPFMTVPNAHLTTEHFFDYRLTSLLHNHISSQCHLAAIAMTV